MAYTVPQFNVAVDVWYTGHRPATDGPDAENVPCQFYLYSRFSLDIQPCELELYQPPIFIRLPTSESANWQNGQIFECPPESGRYFRARFKERMHLGFPNEYLVVVCIQCNADGEAFLRNIEGAIACNPGDEPGGEGAATVVVGVTATGEATTSGGGGSAAGVGDAVIHVFGTYEGAADVTP